MDYTLQCAGIKQSKYPTIRRYKPDLQQPACTPSLSKMVSLRILQQHLKYSGRT